MKFQAPRTEEEEEDQVDFPEGSRFRVGPISVAHSV